MDFPGCSFGLDRGFSRRKLKGSFQWIGFRLGFSGNRIRDDAIFSRKLDGSGSLGFEQQLKGLGLFWYRIRFSEDWLDDITKML